MKTLIFVLAIFLTATSLTTSAGAATHFVDQAAIGADDGSSWTDAYVDLQDALVVAVNGDQIWIAQGVYTPTSSRQRTIHFQIPSGVQIYGGFAGTESAVAERDLAAHRTVLSGDIGSQRPVNTDWDPDATWAQDNSMRLLLVNSVSATTLLDGLEISESGRGMDILGGAPRFANCVIRWNHGTGQGIGALVRYRAMPEFTDVSFERNSSTQRDGGGLAAAPGTSPRFLRVVFRDNSAALEGGGMSGSGEFTDVQFKDNVSQRGGGLAGGGQLSNVIFEGNSGGMYGGGLWSAGGLTAQNVSFIGNQADQGAAFYLGAIPEQYVRLLPTSTFVNLTVADNTPGSGAMIECVATDLSLVSAVLADPVHDGAVPWIAMSDASIAVSYSLVQGSGGSGAGWNPALGADLGRNIDADPGYAGDGNFRLVAGASAIDAGDTAALVPGTETDLDGNPRVAGPSVDMGAWEFQGMIEPPVADEALFDALVTPRSLNVRSRGKFITLSLSALGSTPVDEIDAGSIRLQGTLPHVPGRAKIDDGVFELKFDRGEFVALLEAGETVQIVVTGALFDGTAFEAVDEIRLIGSLMTRSAADPPRAFPNPFNPATTIYFELDRQMRVELGIYDLSGRLVRTLVSGARPAGEHGERWNGTDDAGRPVASGVYFARLRTEDSDRVGRLVLVK